MRLALSQTAFVCLTVAFLSTEVDSAEPAKKLKVVFVQGYEAISVIGNLESDFRPKMRKAFYKDDLSFAGTNGEMDRERLIRAIQQAEILYLSVHGGPTFKEMQTLLVKPSAENKNISPKGNTLITAQEIRDGLKGRSRPKLVVINGCESTTGEGVREENRIISAFGITAMTKGRAFIGWAHSVEGIERDGQFAQFLVRWTAKKPDGKYPTLTEAVNDTAWPIPSLEKLTNAGKTIAPRPTIIGDKDLRYDDSLPDKLELLGMLELPMGDKATSVALDRSVDRKLWSTWRNTKVGSIIKIDNEEMELEDSADVRRSVKRGVNGTTIQPHAKGAKVYLVKSAPESNARPLKEHRESATACAFEVRPPGAFGPCF